MTTNDGTVGRYLGWFLAALSLGAGVIHFAHAGEHFDLSWYHGTFFAAVAWLQLSWAAAIVVKPTRLLLALGALGNAAVVATWIVSRTAGIPFGPGKNVAEDIALADGVCTAFEVGIVLVSLAVLLRPALAQQSIRPTLGFAGLGVAGLAVAIVSSVALTPSFAAEHPHGEADEHAAGAAGDSDGHGDMDDVAGHTNVMIMADGTSDCEESGVAVEGNSGHGHRGPVPFTPLTRAERDQFRGQMLGSYEAIASYSTVTDAEAAGWQLITGYVPCIAAHYINYAALANGFDPAQPEIILFDGQSSDSQIVGLSYLQFSEEEPEGFAGKNDPWHIHETLCIGSIVVGDEGTSDEECAARGGSTVDLGTLWMNHQWAVPGWDSRWGLFSSEHPDLGGTYGDPYG